jgi:hypothetical protein
MIDSRELEVETALREFLRAFENCDLPAMDRLFAPDSVSFDQVIASSLATLSQISTGTDDAPECPRRCDAQPKPPLLRGWHTSHRIEASYNSILGSSVLRCFRECVRFQLPAVIQSFRLGLRLNYPFSSILVGNRFPDSRNSQ